MTVQKILLGGEWRTADKTSTFNAFNPSTKEPLPETYPVSSWADCDAALNAAVKAAEALRSTPAETIAQFLEQFANNIETRAEELAQLAHLETGLPYKPRLADVELPRTTNQLRQSAAAAREGSWSLPTIDTQAGIRAYHSQLGPVAVFGPNNFPLAFGSLSGGDFASAIAAGNPVIGKGHPSHPGTTRILAEEAQKAADATGMPKGSVQLIYKIPRDLGLKLISDPRIAATGFTGSRDAGLAIKAAAEKAGKLAYLEMSSINPVVMLPGALKERWNDLATEFAGSCLMGGGQFCTNPGFVIFLKGAETDQFIAKVAEQFKQTPPGTLLSEGVQQSLVSGIQTLIKHGAEVLAGSDGADTRRVCNANTLLKVSGSQFLKNSEGLQTEAFGNASLFVVADDADQIIEILHKLEGNLTGCIYSDRQGSDDATYDRIAPVLRVLVGRLLNDKMPTGVAVSAAMNHGGPYPATGHPGFTAVGTPASLRRFSMLQCYDSVRPHRLPPILKDQNPGNRAWRLVDGKWTTANLN